MSDGRKWLAGKRLTIADFTIAACYHSVVLNDNVKHDSMKKAMYDSLCAFPQLKEWLKQISTELTEYLKSRPPAPI